MSGLKDFCMEIFSEIFETFYYKNNQLLLKIIEIIVVYHYHETIRNSM